jgi:hypothetical protein
MRDQSSLLWELWWRCEKKRMTIRQSKRKRKRKSMLRCQGDIGSSLWKEISCGLPQFGEGRLACAVRILADID